MERRDHRRGQNPHLARASGHGIEDRRRWIELGWYFPPTLADQASDLQDLPDLRPDAEKVPAVFRRSIRMRLLHTV